MIQEIGQEEVFSLIAGQGAGPGEEGELQTPKGTQVESDTADVEPQESKMERFLPEDLPTEDLCKQFESYLQSKSSHEQGWYLIELLRKFPDFHDHLKKILADQAPAQKTGTDGTN